MKRLISIFSALILLCVTSFAKESAQPAPGLINSAYRASADAFKVGGGWVPFPEYKNREAWNRMLTKEERTQFIKKGEKCLKYQYQHVPVSTFLCFYTTGDKQEMRKIERANRQAFIDLMMAELAEGKGRFLPQIVDGLWFYGTSYHWSHSNQVKAHIPRRENEEVALGNVRLGVTVPVAYWFFKDAVEKMAPQINRVVEEAVERIVIDPYLDESNDEYHWWLGFKGNKVNNWNPWCNHGVAFAALLMEKDQAKLDAVLDRTTRSVDCYFNGLAGDGCCDEGSTYWGQAIPRFIQFLELLETASGGKCTIRPNRKLEDISNYPARVSAGLDEKGNNWCINFGDAGPTLSKNTYSTWSVGKFTGSQELLDYTLARLYNPKSGKFEVGFPFSDEGARSIEYLRCYHELFIRSSQLNQTIAAGTPAEQILADLKKSSPACTLYGDNHQMIVKTGDNWVVGAKYGLAGIQHGHNDVGNVILYVDNHPILIDVGVATYTADTFGPNRFKLWSMRSDWHNCPAPNSALQHNGFEYGDRDYNASHKRNITVFAADIAGAYERDCACTKYVRTISVKDAAESSLSITDAFVLSERKAADLIFFITPGKVENTGKGTLKITSQGTEIFLKYSSNLSASVEEAEIPEPSLKRKWSEGLRRIVLSSDAKAPMTGEYKFSFER